MIFNRLDLKMARLSSQFAVLKVANFWRLRVVDQKCFWRVTRGKIFGGGWKLIKIQNKIDTRIPNLGAILHLADQNHHAQFNAARLDMTRISQRCNSSSSFPDCNRSTGTWLAILLNRLRQFLSNLYTTYFVPFNPCL